MSDLYGEHETRSYEGIWPSLNKLLLILILCALLVPIAYSFMPEVTMRRKLQSQIDELTAKLDNEKLKLANLHRQESLLRTSSEYVATVARDKLDLMGAGETIIRVESPKPAAGKPSTSR